MQLHVLELEDRAVPSNAVGPYAARYVPDRVLVYARTPPDFQNTPTPVTTLRLADNLYRVDLPKGSSVPVAGTWISDIPGVIHAEPDFQLEASVVPNDPLYPDLWGMAESGGPAGWDVARGTGLTVVAVLDTGVDYNHPDLAANMWRNPGEIPGNQLDDDGDGFVDDVFGFDFVNDDADPVDDNGHGTHCAGTIGAVGDNALGVVGVAWKTRVMAIKIMDAGGTGAMSDAAQAVAYADRHGAAVSSNSWGGPGYSEVLRQMIRDTGRLFVAAAGNANADNGVWPQFPAAFSTSVPTVVSVGANGPGGWRAGFSNYGATSVTLAAPGVSVLSLATGGGYRYLSGTSMAAPHVAGALAVLLDHEPRLEPHEAVQRLKEGVVPAPGWYGLSQTGGNLSLPGLFPRRDGKTASAAFTGADATTKGSWVGVYGTAGYRLAAGDSWAAPAVPAPAWVWAESTQDVRALRKPPPATDRLASCWYASGAFQAPVSVTGATPQRVTWYFLDWDRVGRQEWVEVFDAATGRLLDARIAYNFEDGLYLSWDVRGRVVFRFTNSAGSHNAVAAAVFFN